MDRFANQASPKFSLLCILTMLATFATGLSCFAQAKPPDAPPPDTLVLSNGDTLHGKLVLQTGGKVTFHSEPLGDLTIPWENIKELHTGQKFAVLDKNVKVRSKKEVPQIPVGTIDVADQAITVHTEAAPIQPIPVKNAQYIVDKPTLDEQVFHRPSLLNGWNGGATAGTTLVRATQNQYTVAGSLGMVRVVPALTWLDPRNRTSLNAAGSYGKLTEPGYVSGGVPVAATEVKTAIFHFDFERDEYFSPRVFALGQVAFDHNFAQNLQLQQIYGGGLGWTAVRTERQELDLKGTVQYEKQSFINAPPGSDLNLIGSTFSASYLFKAKLFTYTQNLAYIPAFNEPRAYSANETNTVTFPAYKNFAFSLGTIDSYLNDPPVSLPPTKRNSFQFTAGLTYSFKSKY